MVAILALLLAFTDHSPFTLVNATGVALQSLQIRETGGNAWKPLAPPQLSPGARGAVAAQKGEDCAFDIRAETDGGQFIWPAVNLCDVRVVTLRRRADGTLWVDYD